MKDGQKNKPVSNQEALLAVTIQTVHIHNYYVYS